MADDALTALLKRAKLTDAQRAGLWDLYQASKNEDDLAARLKSMELPADIKADLWDAKSKEALPASESSKVESSAGYWEDRGIAGKVWHPASGASERNRVDNQVLGLPPEAAALGALSVGRAVLAPGLSAAKRAVAGATAAAGQAVPIVKGEAVYHGLKYAGVPEPLAALGGVIAAGYRKGGAAKEAAPVAAEVETAAAKPLTPREMTQQLRTEWRTSRGLPAEGYPPKVDAEAVKQEFKAFFNPAKPATAEAAANVPKLKVQETALAMKLLKSGLKAPDVLETILELRKMPVSWRTLPTDAEVSAIVAARKAARVP